MSNKFRALLDAAHANAVSAEEPSGYCELPLADLLPDPEQPRSEIRPEDVDQLAASIRQHGLIAPILVRPAAEADKYHIITGECRYKASLQAGLEHIPCLIKDMADPVQILESQLAENLHRSDISPLDAARAYRRYMTLTGCLQQDLAAKLCLSPASISKSLALLDLPETIQQGIVEGTISPTAGAHIARVRDPAARQELAERVVAEDLDTESLARAARQKQGPAATSKRSHDQVFRLRRGLRLVLHSSKPITAQEVVAALEVALEEARTALDSARA